MEISENGVQREFDSAIRFSDVCKALRTYAGSEV